MLVSELKTIFKDQLQSQYTISEIDFLFSIFADKLLHLNSLELRFSDSKNIDIKEEQEFKRVLHDLKEGKPYQQITQEVDFYGFSFYVNEHVLIPRPETEELLEIAIEALQKSTPNPALKILDVGTGSGIIPIVLKKHFPNAQIEALDYSEQALEVAQKNANNLDVEIQFHHCNYLESALHTSYDVIISNPPYIGRDEQLEIENSVKLYEPNMALFSPTQDPLIFYRKIAKDCEINLKPGGFIFLEINQKLGAETLNLFSDFCKNAHLLKDLSGNDRFVVAQK